MDNIVIVSIGVIATLVVTALAGYQVGHKHGQAFAYRLFRNDVKLDRWYADEPDIQHKAFVATRPAIEGQTHG